MCNNFGISKKCQLKSRLQLAMIDQRNKTKKNAES